VNTPKPIADSLERLLGNLNAPSVDVLDVVFRSWDSIVGPDLAEHTRPAAVDGELLNVVASDPAWATEFRWLETEVVRRLAETTGTDRIQRVQVRVSRSF
jgi:predicted nucleic acid-binding Zn ribbon protein